MDIINLIINSPEFKQTLQEAVKQALSEQQPVVDSQPVYYTRKDLVKLFHISLPTIDRYTQQHIIEGKRVGNRIVYPKQSIDKALREFATRKYKRA